MADGTIKLADLKADGTFDSKHLPSIRSLWYKIAIYCSYNADTGQKSDLLRDCTDYHTVKSVLKAYLAADNIKGSYNLAVYPDVVEELFMDYVDPAYFEASAPPPYHGDDDCPGYNVFNIAMSTIQEATHVSLQNASDSLDQNTAFLESFGPTSSSNNSSSSGDDDDDDDVKLCGVAAWMVEVRTLGQFDQLGTYLPSGLDIAPGVSISKAGLPTPAVALTPGEAVKVSIYNFPPGR